MPRTEREVAIEVGTATIQRGDVIMVGGNLMTVQNLFTLPGGAKRIEFAGGTVLTLFRGTTLTAFRIAKGWRW